MWYVARYIAVAPPSEPGRQHQVRLRHPTRRRCSRHRCLRRLLSLRLLPAPALPLARCCRRRRDCLPPLCLARATRLCFRAPLLPRTSVSACLRFCAPLLPPPRSLPPAPPPRPPAVTHPLSSFCGSLGPFALRVPRASASARLCFRAPLFPRASVSARLCCRHRALCRLLRRRALQLSPTPSLAFVAVWACWLLVCGVLLSVM